MTPLLATVTLRHRVASVEDVVRELEEASGRPLGIKAEMRDEALYVALGPHTPEETMRLLARSASAEWIEDAGRLYLGRSASFRRRQSEAERAALAADLRKRLDKVLGPDAAVPWPEGSDPVATALAAAKPLMVGPGYTRWNNIRTRMIAFTPAGRLLSRTLRALGPDGLAAIPPSTLVHYSSAPLRFQQRMPGLTPASRAQFVRESAIMEARLSAMPDDQRKETAQTLTLYGDGRGVAGSDLLLNVSRSVDGDYGLMLHAYDAAKRPTITSRLDLAAPDPTIPEELPGRERWGRIALGVIPVETEEPLDGLVGAPVRALVEAVGGEAILPLPDGLPSRLETFPGEKLSLTVVAKGLSALVAFERSNGILVGHARRPFESASTKAFRAPLRRLLRTHPEGAEPSLDATLDYVARQNPLAASTELEKFVLARFARNNQSPVWCLVALGRGIHPTLAALSPSQRSTLWAGGPVPYLTFGPTARTAFERSVFTKSVTLAGMEGKIDDPSVWLDAIPENGVLRVGDRNSDLMAVAQTKDGPLPYGLDNLAFAQAKREAGEPLDAYPDVVTTKFRAARAEARSLVFDLGKGVGIQAGRVQEYAVAKDAMPISGLPPEHRAAYERAYKAAKGG